MKAQMPRTPAKTRHNMPYIADRQLYLAVMFARTMMRGGKPPGLANTIAARYYGFPVHYTGMVGASVAKRNSQLR